MIFARILSLLLLPSIAHAERPLSVPFERHTLGNGLVVLLHPDHSVPTVAVNLMVGVGSRDEVAGRTGFAHLFEHLMFMGTRRVPRGEFDAVMEAEGAWNNAWTSEDRTDYFEVGPSHTLPLLLWLEADRLRDLGGQIDAEKLALQRDVVRNERRQTSEDTPYGQVELRLPELLWPAEHPYHHPVIGSHEDLQAASVQDVQQFFARWYVPANAILCIAGDFDPTATLAEVQRLFAGIPSPGGKPQRAARIQGRPAPAATAREVLGDDVELARVVVAWRSAPTMTDEDAALDIVGRVLADGKGSRLWRSLVQEQGLAQDVEAQQWSAELGSTFYIQATVREGVEPEALETALQRELDIFRVSGPSDLELRRARLAIRRDLLHALEGVEGRARLLNTYESFAGDAALLQTVLDRYGRATVDSVRVAASTLDPAHRVTVVVVPQQVKQ